jgi:hypothetical protein
MPLLLVLVAFMLRVDELVSKAETPKKPAGGGRKKFAVTNEDGEAVLTDPDGRGFGGEKSSGK